MRVRRGCKSFLDLRLHQVEWDAQNGPKFSAYPRVCLPMASRPNSVGVAGAVL
jgi:hypothetical protein